MISNKPFVRVSFDCPNSNDISLILVANSPKTWSVLSTKVATFDNSFSKAAASFIAPRSIKKAPAPMIIFLMLRSFEPMRFIDAPNVFTCAAPVTANFFNARLLSLRSFLKRAFFILIVPNIFPTFTPIYFFLLIFLLAMPDKIFPICFVVCFLVTVPPVYQ